ncbi:hypothetical protein LUZ60_005049 [Juncus effusus]|nr:hypothetical protein LUZ60_005049 [Juncus effusus]
MSTLEQPSSPRLRIYFVPLPSPGHVIPMVDIAKIFTMHGAECTIILTPLNASRFSSTITQSNIRLVIFQFPSDVVGLPTGCESTDVLPSRDLSGHFAMAVDLLEQPFRDLLQRDLPDAIVSDAFLPWTAIAAAELNIPRYSFPGTGCFALSVERSLLLNRPQQNVTSDSDMFLVPGLPDEIYLTQTRLAEATLPGEHPKEFFDRAREADNATVGWVANTFGELESQYIKHFERETNKPVFAIGPVCLSSTKEDEIIERGRSKELTGDYERILKWLDEKTSQSVVYVCFGSLSRLPKSQLREIGYGLVDSGVPFIWVVGGGEDTDEIIDELAIAARQTGQIIKEWAPQFAILGHSSVGAFITHCGWGGVTEAASLGKVMLTWPLFAEQFYNEKFVVEVARIGEAMGTKKGYVWGQEEKGGVVLMREKITEKVRWAVGTGADDVRKKAYEIGKKSKMTVAKGGSSYENAERMMENIRGSKRDRS